MAQTLEYQLFEPPEKRMDLVLVVEKMHPPWKAGLVLVDVDYWKEMEHFAMTVAVVVIVVVAAVVAVVAALVGVVAVAAALASV